MANSTVIGLLRVLLSMNSAEFEATLKRTRSAAKAWSKDLGSVGRQAQTLGANLTRTLTLPIAGAGVAMAKFAIDFESSFAGVRKTVDATEAEFAQMAQGFRDLAKTIPVNVNELNRLGEAAGALGIPKAQVVDFARVMALLGVTTNVTSDQAAESIAKIQNIFGAAGKDTERFASTLVALGNDGASTESQILELAKRIAGAGHTIGLTQAQVLGFASALANVGIEADAGGTAISRVFIDMAKAVAKGGEKLNDFAHVAGMSGAAFAKAFKTDAAGAAQAFIDGLVKIQQAGGKLFGTLDKLNLSDRRVIDTMTRLAGSADNVSHSLGISAKGWRENTALTIEAQKRFETTASKLRLLWQRIQDVGITIGNALLPGIKSTIAATDRLLPLIEQAAQTFAKLPGPLQAFAVASLAAAASAGPLLYAFGQLSISAGALTGAFASNGLLTKALGTLGAALTPVTGAVAAFGAMLVATRAATGSWTETLEVLAVPFAGTLKMVRTLTEALGLHSRALTDVVRIVDDVWILGLRELRKALSTTYDSFVIFARGMVALAKALADDIGTSLTRVIGLLTQVLPGSMQVALAGLLALGGKLPKVGDALHATADALDRVVAEGKNIGKNIGADVDKPIQKVTTTAHGATGALNDLGGGIEGLDDPLKRFIKNAQSLEAQLRAAYKAGVPMPILLEEFKSQIEEITHKAPIFGKAIGEATKTAAEALKHAELDKVVAAANKALAADARQAMDALQNDLARAAVAFPAELKKSNQATLKFLLGVEQDAVSLQKDSLQKRLKLVHLEYESKRNDVKAFAGPFMSEQLAIIDEQERQAADAATQAWRDHLSDLKRETQSYGSIFRNALSSVPGLFQQAFTGGGGLGGAGKALASGLGGALGGKLFGDLARHASNFFAKTFGVGVTSALGNILPGIGAAIGSLAGPLIGGLVNHFFGTAGRDLVEQFVQQNFGSFDQLHEALNKNRDALQAAGYDAEQLWIHLTQGVGRNNPEQAKQAIDQITKAFEAAGQKLQGFNASVGGILQQIVALGGTLDDTTRAYLQTLAETGELTDDNIALLQQLSGQGEVSWQTVQAAVERYGGSVEKLGGSFQKARLHDAWQQVIDDVDLFTRAGVSAGDILHLTQDKIIALAQESARFGTEIPENMRPWIEKLIQSGKLVDANGKKITDINRLTFGETLQTTLQKLNDSLRELIDLFKRVPGAIGNIPKSVDIDVRVRRHEEVVGAPVDETSGRATRTFARGGLVPQYLDAGGTIAAAMGFRPRGTDTVPAMLTPGELVLNEAQQGRLAQSIAMGMAALEQVDRLRLQPPPAAIDPSSSVVRQVIDARREDPDTGEATTIQVIFNDGAFRAVDTDGLRQMITDKALPVIVEAMRENRRGVRTDFRHAIGVTG